MQMNFSDNGGKSQRWYLFKPEVHGHFRKGITERTGNTISYERHFLQKGKLTKKSSASKPRKKKYSRSVKLPGGALLSNGGRGRNMKS